MGYGRACAGMASIPRAIAPVKPGRYRIPMPAVPNAAAPAARLAAGA